MRLSTKERQQAIKMLKDATNGAEVIIGVDSPRGKQGDKGFVRQSLSGHVKMVYIYDFRQDPPKCELVTIAEANRREK